MGGFLLFFTLLFMYLSDLPECLWTTCILGLELRLLGSERGSLEQRASTLASEPPSREGYVPQCHSTQALTQQQCQVGACGSADLQAHPCYLHAPRMSTALLCSHSSDSGMGPREPDSGKHCSLYHTSGRCERSACQSAHATRVIGILCLRSEIPFLLP